MAREKKITIKYFQNTKVKPDDNGNYPLYLRLRYDRVQAEVPSSYKLMADQRFGREPINNNRPSDEAEEYVRKEENRISLINEEKGIIESIIKLHAKAGTNFLKNKPGEQLKYSLTSIRHIVNLTAGIDLIEAIHSNGLESVANCLDLSSGFSQLMNLDSIANSEFKKFLKSFHYVEECMKFFDSNATSGKIYRAHDWMIMRDEITEKLKDYCQSPIGKIQSLIDRSASRHFTIKAFETFSLEI